MSRMSDEHLQPVGWLRCEANFDPIQSMVVVGNTAYYTPGYNEARYGLYSFSLSNINQVTGYGVGPGSLAATSSITSPATARRSTRCGKPTALTFPMSSPMT